MTVRAPDPAAWSCPNCAAELNPDGRFCDACGAAVAPAAALSQQSPDGFESPTSAGPSASDGGMAGGDGSCRTHPTEDPTERDHYVESPAAWVAAVCDRGLRHPRNEDATAVAADPEPGSRAVLVVCDGVSSSLDSDVASLAGARAARDVLVTPQPDGSDTATGRAGAIARSLEAAAAAANAAVVANTAMDSTNAASCTFAAAVIEGHLVVFGNVGDSRVYWIPDAGEQEAPVELSLDDSVAQMRISVGVPREQAENSPQAHAITKWLGRESPDFTPRTGAVTVTSPGWLLVCSDGLWNYVSEAADLQLLVSQLGDGSLDALPLAQALVRWANEQGGKDNISVALARH